MLNSYNIEIWYKGKRRYKDIEMKHIITNTLYLLYKLRILSYSQFKTQVNFLIIVCLLLTHNNMLAQSKSFKEQQLLNSRVKTAYADKERTVKQYFKDKQIEFKNFKLLLIAYKTEALIEAWIKPSDKDTFILLKQFPICSSSGTLGPKRKQGDYQVPEGFYHIDRFNPYSNFYLSLGVNYPNSSDKILGEKGNLGGDIFIHGSCVTIGCMPITDELIKELYILAVEAKNNGQQDIPVFIFPAKLTDENYNKLKPKYSEKSLVMLLENLKTGYDYFQSKKTLPKISVNTNGSYSIK